MIDHQKQSGFYLLSDNTDAFVARFALATAAENTLDIQYYIMHKDASVQYLAYALLQSSDRGVKFRKLVEDINLSCRDINLKAHVQNDNNEKIKYNPHNNQN